MLSAGPSEPVGDANGVRGPRSKLQGSPSLALHALPLSFSDSILAGMKLTLRRECQPHAFQSFLWFIDIKTGVKIVLLFAVLNKVAGFYGLIAMLLGAGGSFLQISMYLYSLLGLGAYAWGLKSIYEVRSPTASCACR